MSSSIYTRNKFSVSFTSEGKIYGFWSLQERIREEVRQKVNRDKYLHPGTELLVTRLNNIVMAAQAVLVAGTQQEYLELMVEAVALMKEIGSFLNLEVELDTTAIENKEVVTL